MTHLTFGVKITAQYHLLSWQLKIAPNSVCHHLKLAALCSIRTMIRYICVRATRSFLSTAEISIKYTDRSTFDMSCNE